MTDKGQTVAVFGGFDDIKYEQLRFLEESSKYGELHVFLWSDELIEAQTGSKPRFPVTERFYFLGAVRHVTMVHVIGSLPTVDELPTVSGVDPTAWFVCHKQDNMAKRMFCENNGMHYKVLGKSDLAACPAGNDEIVENGLGNRKVIVTGCFDWFHSGHVRFLEEVSELGDLYVVVGHDVNVRELKGDGHPMYSEDVRRYIVGSVRFVTQALVSTGHGWMDAAPEIHRIKPDMYAVNEDGDKEDKRAFCEEHGLQYVVLSREPAPGLVRRSSTDLRGF